MANNIIPETQHEVPLPAWLDPSNEAFDSNWDNRLSRLSEPVYVRLGTGIHPIFSAVHLQKAIFEDCGVIVAAPTQPVEPPAA